MLIPKNKPIRSEKQCRICGELKPIEKFGIKRTAKYGDGYSTQCKLCRNKSILSKRKTHIFGGILRTHDLTEEQIFEERYMPEPNSGCWLWLFEGPSGYGYFKYKNTQRFAHRASWEIYKGPIPEGLMVLHKCDVRICVNPNHLFLGTHQDNMDDMKKKKRCPGKRGELSPTSKLTNEQALEIFHAKGFHKDIAKKYNISRRSVGFIKKGITWTHVTNTENKNS